MSSLRGQPFRWAPRTVTDALATSVADDPTLTGSMVALTNLVPDPTTLNQWVCRPAAQQSTSFAGFNTPGFVSALLVVGSRAYGMIASAANPGNDEPFCYDLAGGSFIPITGVTAANTPTSPVTTGTWTPPCLALVGQYVVVCHPGFDGVTHFVGWIDLTTFGAPSWSSGNTATNALPSVPVSVAQFNGRAYYLCNPPNANPAALLSDSLAPKARTVQNTILTFGDNVPLVAAAGLPLNTTTGGIVQVLMVFREDRIHQITGDPATSNLSLNTLNVPIGTKSPLSICTTPNGLAFVAKDGLRVIDFTARISDPIGKAGTGVTEPFIDALYPSRICAACNAAVVRVTVQNSGVLGNPQQEWWFDLQRNVWSGPHTFGASLIQPYGISFVMAPLAVTASLWTSDSLVTPANSYIENGAALTFTYQTSLLPDAGQLSAFAIIESDIWAGFDAASSAFTVIAYDENGVGLDTCTISGLTAAAGIWGHDIWGRFIWGGKAQALSPRRLKWTKPLVFNRLSIQVQGTSAAQVRLGDLFARVEVLGYIPNQ